MSQFVPRSSALFAPQALEQRDDLSRWSQNASTKTCRPSGKPWVDLGMTDKLTTAPITRISWKDVGRAWFMLAALVTAPFWASLPALRDRVLARMELIAEKEKRRAGLNQ